MMLHWAQIYLTGEFREFDNNIFDSLRPSGIPLTTFTVPQRFIWMSGDTLCPPANQKPFLPAINAADEVTLAGDHYYPGGANSDAFMTDLYSLLGNAG